MVFSWRQVIKEKRRESHTMALINNLSKKDVMMMR
jgi:hypothetical protein